MDVLGDAFTGVGSSLLSLDRYATSTRLNNMISLLYLAIGLNLITNGNSFILIPEELTTLLNIFYSRIPPTKLGTDSKVGLGFRIGRNADFQVVFEIGPQQNSLSENTT